MTNKYVVVLSYSETVVKDIFKKHTHNARSPARN